MSALMKSPSANFEWLIVKPSREKSGLPTSAATSGVMRSLTSAFTTAVKAAPSTTATARSITLPRAMNALNPENVRASFAPTERSRGVRRDPARNPGRGPVRSSYVRSAPAAGRSCAKAYSVLTQGLTFHGCRPIPKYRRRSYRTRVFSHMDVPDNLDTFLRDLLKEEGGAVQLDDDDRAFIDRILHSITQGSKGVFVVLHPNDRMQYMLLNTNRAGAIALLAKVMQRTAEALEADLD